MPILIDYSAISVANSMSNLLKEIENQDASLINLIRHQVINSLRSLNRKYRKEYGELIICCDDHKKKYWRKEYFPYYKGNRKNNLNKKIDFDLLYSFVNQIKQELKDNFPYKVIEVPAAEGDDIIAILTKHFSSNESFKVNSNSLIDSFPPVLICASDNDFFQLGKYDNVEQHSLKHKKILKKHDNPDLVLMEKFLRGETGDGIPNVLSDDNCLVDKIKQKSCTKKFVSDILETKVIPEHLKRNYDRNRTLIDFSLIPKELESSIIDSYNSCQVKGNDSKLFNYFMVNRLRQHMDNINDFKVEL